MMFQGEVKPGLRLILQTRQIGAATVFCTSLQTAPGIPLKHPRGTLDEAEFLLQQTQDIPPYTTVRFEKNLGPGG